MMKKITIALMVVLSAASCCKKKEMTLNGKVKTFEYYGLLDKDQIKNDSINYEISTGSVVAGIIFCETIAAPVYIFGWNLYEPVSVKVEYRQP